MGCFLSLHFGIRESERRTRRREQQNLENPVSSNARDELVNSADPIILFPNFQTSDDNNKFNANELGSPLKRIRFNWSLSEEISKTDLEARRIAFWETCYSNGGQDQVWDALKIICQDEKDDLCFAQTLLESCGVILPYGQLTEIYDSTGFRYHLPSFCVCDPVNCNEEFDKSSDIVTENSMNQRLDKIKIRLSDGKDILMEARKVSDIKKYIRLHEKIEIKRRIVVLWRGKVLEDSTKLDSLNLPKGAVLQVMLPS